MKKYKYFVFGFAIHNFSCCTCFSLKFLSLPFSGFSGFMTSFSSRNILFLCVFVSTLTLLTFLWNVIFCYQWWMFLAVIFHVSSSNRCSFLLLFFANEMLKNYLRAYTYENQSRKCDFMLLCIKQVKKNCKEASFLPKFFCCLCMQLEREKSNIVIRTFTIKFFCFLRELSFQPHHLVMINL